MDLALTYGSVLGSLELRSRLAELHSTSELQLTAENVVITPGSIMANYLVLTTLLGPGDHVVCQFPTYAQLYALPRHLGVQVDLWKSHPEDNWVPSIEELEKLIQPHTKAIIIKYVILSCPRNCLVDLSLILHISNPSNPTGTVLPLNTLLALKSLAERHNLVVFSDEVFRPLFHSADPPPPPFVTLRYDQSVSTGSVSKAHGLPGVRLGWVISPNRVIIDRIITARDYTTISVSRLDDSVALFALRSDVLPRLMQRNLAKCAKSISMLERFIETNKGRVSWVKPSGGGVAFIRIYQPKNSLPVSDVALCESLARQGQVSTVPGDHCFGEGEQVDFQGYLRLAIGDDYALDKGLRVLQTFLDSEEVFTV